MRRFFYLTMTLLPLAVCCGGGGDGTSRSCRPVEDAKPKTAAKAYEIAASRRFSEVPDTVFLGYYLGMTKAEADALTRDYVKSKKLKREHDIFSGNDFYNYQLQLGKQETRAQTSFLFHRDTLSAVTMYFPDLEDYDLSSHSGIFALEDFFAPIYVKKGFHMICQGFDEESKDVAAQKLARLVNSGIDAVYDPTPNPTTDGVSVNFYRGNTCVEIFRLKSAFGPALVIMDVPLREAMKKAAAQSRRMEMESSRADF